MYTLCLLLVSFASADAAMFEAEKTPSPYAVRYCNVILPVHYEKQDQHVHVQMCKFIVF
jgi:hypothetical protein